EIAHQRRQHRCPSIGGRLSSKAERFCFLDESNQHARHPGGWRVVGTDPDSAVVTHCLAGQPVLGPEPSRIPAVHFDRPAHRHTLHEVVSQRRQRRLVVQTPGKGRRDRNDGPAGYDRKIHPCCADAALALADVRHGGAADYSFAERICHAKRKLLGAAIEAAAPAHGRQWPGMVLMDRRTESRTTPTTRMAGYCCERIRPRSRLPTCAGPPSARHALPATRVAWLRPILPPAASGGTISAMPASAAAAVRAAAKVASPSCGKNPSFDTMRSPARQQTVAPSDQLGNSPTPSLSAKPTMQSWPGLTHWPPSS